MPRRSQDPIKAATRRSKAQRRVGEGATCVTCGEAWPLALEAGSKPMTCAECRRRLAGLKITDAHHVAGQKNSPKTLDIPANDHRAALSAAQYDWPRTTLENPEGSPVLATAATLRGTADVIMWLIDEFIDLAVAVLEALDPWLREKLGPNWWIATPLERYAPRD